MSHFLYAVEKKEEKKQGQESFPVYAVKEIQGQVSFSARCERNTRSGVISCTLWKKIQGQESFPVR